ncbi:hypothetical protein L2E82_29743 [Cichorium intybus]|uniref:Uncharacterized protein n=1 Tax=Cichorium intybus TaxID=13427 RepID=A0ACB9CYT2_CICIN|nr:hypothetical protein L2E82_29743 [Cichorium intybus]
MVAVGTVNDHEEELEIVARHVDYDEEENATPAVDAIDEEQDEDEEHEDLEDMKKRLEEIKEEAGALREMQAKVEKEMGFVQGLFF